MCAAMGVEYQRWLIPQGSVFLPSAAAIAKLVARLRKEGFVANPASPDFAKLRFQGKRASLAARSGAYAVKTVDNDFGGDAAKTLAACTEAAPAGITAAWLEHPSREELRIVWPVDAAVPLPVKYPMSRVPAGAEDLSYALELHRASDYVVPSSEGIGPLPAKCACGEALAFEWDASEVVTAFQDATGIFAECEECGRTFDPSKSSARLRNPFDGSGVDVRGGAAYRFALKVDCGKCFAADAELAFAPELVAVMEAEFGRSFLQFGSTY